MWTPYLLFTAGICVVLLQLVTALHALLYKRDPRATVSWIGVILMVPLLGSILYFVFGINRIERRAVSLRRRRHAMERLEPGLECTLDELREALPPEKSHLTAISPVGASLLGRPLLEANNVTPLVNGEEAYPAMLGAIEEARVSISLSMYIFEKDSVGDRFIEAIGKAANRGVAVRVLIDDLGGGSTLSATERAFEALGVRMARFQRLFFRGRLRFANLRNHRKILVVDGRVGFTGGMNIRESNLLERPGPRHEQDVHFRLEGPVVRHLQEAFVDDWAFVSDEELQGEAWFPRLEGRGKIPARGIPFDPGLKLDTLRCVLVGAIGAARMSIRIITPYFIADPALVSVLKVASMRGVRVDILLPSRSDNPVIHWAMTAMLWQVLQGGCRVWLTPPPFDHTKLTVVDDAWLFLGSANWDPRSLRLNFEFNVECYDAGLAGRMGELIEGRRANARELTLQEVDRRPLGVRVRDGVARLFSPYL